jgi:tetratricopeptide (TPR) repeat protein/glycosyltransferase involved in cell wall biosynthesis
MYTLISFATGWGSKYGGINSFNTDFLSAFGVAYSHSAQVVCMVASATEEEKTTARNSSVSLIPLPYKPSGNEFGEAQVEIAVDELLKQGISFDPANTVWLGHDRITGVAAIKASKSAGGRSAVIHHMSYDHYEAFAENSQTAYEKVQAQKSLLEQADLVLAVGPLLRDAASDRLGSEKNIHMLIPGLAEIKVREAPKTFTAFMSGRLCKDAARIKQGHLGIAAFAKAHCEARDNGMPDGLCRQPKLVLRGVDYEAERTAVPEADVESELKKFAEEYADCVINLHALPFTQDRNMLYEDLRAASVALMPSWHEGFGLVAWEAIAAGVPLIVCKNSGVYQLLEEYHPGSGTGCVYPIDVRAATGAPFFHQDDVRAVVSALKAIAQNPGDARRKAGALRSMLGEYSWQACVNQAVQAFSWPLHQGSITTVAVTEAFTPTPHQQVETVAIASDVPLQLPAKHWRRGIGMADSMLLRAEEEVVSFDSARQPEIDMLNAWLDDPETPQAVRLIAGAGGSGKTRLALELCRQRVAAGWIAGFLDTCKDMRSTWQTLKNCHKPLLIAIDYAETRQAALLALIKSMVQAPCDQPVRLLLLARAGGEWWDKLPSKDPYCEALLGGYATSLFNLPPLHPDELGRQHAYKQALHSFSQALAASPPGMVPDLSAEHFERPLYVQMAALLALHGERPTTAEGLTRALLNHERRYWKGLLAHYGWAEAESLAQQLLALATLAGGFATPKDAFSHWTAAGLSTLSGPDFNVLFNSLATLYPGRQGLQPVRPDLLGEALVAQTLCLPECGNLLNAVLAKTSSQTVRRHALTVLARLSSNRVEVHETIIDALVTHYADCCKDLIAVAVETPSDLPMLAEVAFTRLLPAVKSQVAGLLQSIVAKESVQLSGMCCIVSEYLAEKAKEKWIKKPSSLIAMAEYASALGNYSVSLLFVGLPDNALSCAFDVVKLSEKLFNRDRKSFESLYASSLNNYSKFLSDAGKNVDALKYSYQSLEIHQRLAQKNPDRHDPAHATALNNYANRLSEAGNNEEALKYAYQSLEIRQRLAQKNPDRYVPDHAKSLNSYANCLSEVGNNEEALKYAYESLEIHQRLVQKNPDRYDPDHAGSLNNYANRLSEAGNNEEALKYAYESLKIYQRLAQKNPDRYDPDHAKSLSNYAIRLSKAGNNEEALKYSYQSLEIHQRLAQKNPDRYDLDHAKSLNNYANCLSDAGNNEDALKYACQALEIHQRLAQRNPARFEVNKFSTACQVSFLNWLSDSPANDEELDNLDNLPLSVAPHNRLLLELYAAFVYGWRSVDRTVRCKMFGNVVSLWSDLNTSTKSDAQPYWLCSAAWCSRFAPEAVAGVDWQSTWRDYVRQRQGRIPKWMHEVARRLEFEWPE